MGDIVNLKHHRKQQVRAQQDAKAAQNRLLFGRTKAQKALDQKTQQSIQDDLDGKKMQDS